MLRLVLCCLITACRGASPRLAPPRLDGRIVGGQTVDISDFPYQLSMEYRGSHRCGAAIIDANTAVTAAHCTDRLLASEVVFRAGSSVRGINGTLHQAISIRVHPRYSSFYMDYDVSTVTVIPRFDLYSPTTPLRTVKLTTKGPQAGDQVVITGWGVTAEGVSAPADRLQAVGVAVVDHGECSEAYASYGGVTDRMLCAGVPQGGKDACQGDSGGPVVNATNHELVGLVSWGVGCGRPGYPGVHTDVYSLRGWLGLLAN